MISEKELRGINSPFRNFSLKMKIATYKRKLEKLHIKMEQLTMLDAGCGRGVSTKIFIEKFSPKKIFAFDYSQNQINLAKKLKLNAEFFHGNITDINLPSSCCDFVFVFNVLHHVPKWKEGIKEISRVLKNKKFVIFEEPTGSYTTFTDMLARIKHPEEAKFSKIEFQNELTKNNFIIIKDSSTFFGYIALICQKKEKNEIYAETVHH